MLRYYKLFDLLFRKNMKLTDLRKVLSSATIAKLRKGEYISGEALDKLCDFLECQPEDIIEHYKVLSKTKFSLNLIAIKTIKEINEYGEEKPNGEIFTKGITEPLNEKGQPVQGWYEKELSDIYNNLEYYDKCQLDYDNALINKKIRDTLDSISNIPNEDAAEEK